MTWYVWYAPELYRCAENDAGFYQSLTTWCECRAAFINPANERRAWLELLNELGSGSAGISHGNRGWLEMEPTWADGVERFHQLVGIFLALFDQP